jgi:hypothetical protein
VWVISVDDFIVDTQHLDPAVGEELHRRKLIPDLPPPETGAWSRPAP